MLTQFETNMISRAVKALEDIADELKSLNALKKQELSKVAKKSDVC